MGKFSKTFADGHKHDNNAKSAKGYAQCSQCGKLMVSGKELQEMKRNAVQSGNAKGSKTAQSAVIKRSSSNNNANSKVIRKSAGNAAVGSAAVQPEEVQGRQAKRLETGIPRGIISQKEITPSFIERLQTKVVQGTLIKQVGANSNPELKRSFRKIKELS